MTYWVNQYIIHTHIRTFTCHGRVLVLSIVKLWITIDACNRPPREFLSSVYLILFCRTDIVSSIFWWICVYIHTTISSLIKTSRNMTEINYYVFSIMRRNRKFASISLTIDEFLLQSISIARTNICFFQHANRPMHTKVEKTLAFSWGLPSLNIVI